ncbi:MAG: PD-(D/E)XK nuclease superfamily protein [Bacteroidia bacterium]|nr:PD-(D/E)XK nuclease superfamily protein [Bacteroidia bacterium]
MSKKRSETGNMLESVVLNTFIQKGFKSYAFSHYEKRKEKIEEHSILLTNAPFENIYGQVSRTEFLAISPDFQSGPIRIECKWQQTSGSVDEKFPYLYLNVIEAMPEKTIVILYGGGGYRHGAIEWLKKAVVERLYQVDCPKTILVFNIDEFIKWANNNFR